MIQHVVVWKFKESTEDLQNQFVEGLKDRLMVSVLYMLEEMKTLMKHMMFH